MTDADTKLALEQQLCDTMAELLRRRRPRLMVWIILRLLIALVLLASVVLAVGGIILIVQTILWRNRRIREWKELVRATREGGRPFLAFPLIANQLVGRGVAAPSVVIGCEEWGVESHNAVWFGDVASKFGIGSEDPSDAPFAPMLEDQRYVAGRKRSLPPELCGGSPVAAYDVVIDPKIVVAPLSEWWLIPYLRIETSSQAATMQIPWPVMKHSLDAAGMSDGMYTNPAAHEAIVAMITMGLTGRPMVPGSSGPVDLSADALADEEPDLNVEVPGSRDPVT